MYVVDFFVSIVVTMLDPILWVAFLFGWTLEKKGPFVVALAGIAWGMLTGFAVVAMSPYDMRFMDGFWLFKVISGCLWAFFGYWVGRWFENKKAKKAATQIKVKKEESYRFDPENSWWRGYLQDEEKTKNENVAAARRRAEEQSRKRAEEERIRHREEEQIRKRAAEEQARRKTKEGTARPHSVVSEEIQRYFAFFELPITASFDDVKKKYIIMMKLFHPDKYFSDDRLREYAEKKTKELNSTFATLKAKHFSVK